MSEREKELEAALREALDALTELMACSADMLNSRVGQHLYKQCHSAQMRGNPLVRPDHRRNLVNQGITDSEFSRWKRGL